MSIAISVNSVTKRYEGVRGNLTALDNVSLQIEEG
ncbi:MAG: ABC transporter ATP-binding protein, partial [Brachymonas sp.]|nr:ABC transporter ATP-binding protein [Brachymonas sp.]